jgi:hypothetical protein
MDKHKGGRGMTFEEWYEIRGCKIGINENIKYSMGAAWEASKQQAIKKILNIIAIKRGFHIEKDESLSQHLWELLNEIKKLEDK